MTQELSIKNFYEHSEIFITGANGLIGKFLVEKLLRSCPGIKKIFLLLRSKKGLSAEQRFKNLKENLVFNVLKEQNPKALDKLEVIEGDCSQIGLGISQNDLKKLRNVSIVIHSAASVNFTDPLKDVLLINTRGTREICRIAEELNDLVAFVYVSTVYNNPSVDILEEKVYPTEENWENFIELAKNIDSHALRVFEKKLLQQYPNTYAFSKRLAEQVCNHYCEQKSLPIIIYRPSIVSAPENEPERGLMDMMNGVSAMEFAYVSGLFRTLKCDSQSGLDMIPIDICVKGIIVAACKKGTELESYVKVNSIDVYNSANIKFLNYIELREIPSVAAKKRPFKNMLWKPNIMYTKSKCLAQINLLWAQVIPALFFDLILKLKGQKTIVTKLLRMLVAATETQKCFTDKIVVFDNSNFKSLNEFISENEEKDFFLHETITSKSEYIDLINESFLKYIIKQTENENEKALTRYKIINVMDFVLKSFTYGVTSYILIKFLTGWF